MPDLDAPSVDHGHDLMAGSVIARLAPQSIPDEFRHFETPHTVTQQLAGDRTVTAWIAPDLMLGAESSTADWGGWAQFMPVTAHWGSGDELAVLWLVDPHVVDAAGI